MFWCWCNVPLHLQDSVSERVGGFWSHLYIRCSNLDCQTITDIPTDKLGPSGNYFLLYFTSKQLSKDECEITFLDTLILSWCHEKYHFKYFKNLPIVCEITFLDTLILSGCHEKHHFKYFKNPSIKVCKIWCIDVYMYFLYCDIFWWKLINSIFLRVLLKNVLCW